MTRQSLQAKLEADYAADLQAVEEDYEALTRQAEEHYQAQLDAIAAMRKRAIQRLDEKYQLHDQSAARAPGVPTPTPA